MSPACLQGRAEMFAAPAGQVGVADAVNGLVQRFGQALGEERADTEHQGSHAVLSVFSRQVFERGIISLHCAYALSVRLLTCCFVSL